MHGGISPMFTHKISDRKLIITSYKPVKTYCLKMPFHRKFDLLIDFKRQQLQ